MSAGGKVFKPDPSLEGLRCRCGGRLEVGEDDEGRAGVVHTMPTCAAFDEIDRPADFLAYVRTGKRPEQLQ